MREEAMSRSAGQRRTRADREALQAEIARLLSFGGYSYREIAAEVGVSDTQVCRYAQRIMADWREKALGNTEEHVAREVRKLDERERAFRDLALAGDCDSDERLQKIATRRAKLLGLDKAANVDLTLLTAEEASVESKIEWMAANVAAGQGVPTGWGDAALNDPANPVEDGDDDGE